ncbi:hypothetical protein AVEN_210105-1 [Araneus ventricosus]|uniref:Uncharacterized protein n=1 Tax=Araneus ventricosus TaxID=182803 RepID=A0A4Y2G9X1_ARAVE|nr:hypothetical protein AVEN_210105-1 [Araneus ventricosus]
MRNLRKERKKENGSTMDTGFVNNDGNRKQPAHLFAVGGFSQLVIAHINPSECELSFLASRQGTINSHWQCTSDRILNTPMGFSIGSHGK